MTCIGKIQERISCKWVAILLFTCALSLLSARPAQAQSSVGCVAFYGGLIDGNVNPNPNSHIDIDGNCIIRNFPASNPFTANVSFFGNNPTSWLVVFDNVVFAGNMSCDKSQGNYIWFTNGSISGLRPNCQNLFVPTEKINKQNPPGPPVATIGVPFTWKLTMPVLFDPLTGTVTNPNGSPNDLHDITITDDLNATGADLSFVSATAYGLNGATVTLAPGQPSNVGGVLTFSGFPTILAGQQFVIELTVVLNDTPNNVPGRQFINTAKWQFGRLVGGVFVEPLPGQNGVTPPMTIAGPSLVLRKSGPATMTTGQPGSFALDVQNTGNSDAWNVSLRDMLPHGATGGMCNTTPVITSAQVFAADGVTPVPGKGPLNQGSDYTFTYSGSPNCQLDLTVQTAAGTIGPNQRLIVRYQTQLDANTQNGATLTNIAGAIQWFNGDSSISTRKATTKTLTDGTPGVLDFQDAFIVTVALTGYEFDKTVVDLTSGANPATTAAPGDKLRYTLRFRSSSQALSNFSIFDDMDALNAAQPAFAAGTLALVSAPAGADISNTSSTGGTNRTGVIDIRNLNLPVNSQVVIQFDITLKPGLRDGTVVSNQATVQLASGPFAWSDDPNVNGIAPDPTMAGREDPTRVTIAAPAPAFLVQKISTYLRNPQVLLPGDTMRYTITVKNTGSADAVNVTLRDAVPANTTYVAGSTTLNGAKVADVAGVSPLVNGMLIDSPANPTPGSMPASTQNGQTNVATITFDVIVNPATPGGTVISNQGFVSATGITDQPSDDPRTPAPNDPTRDTVSSPAAPGLILTKSGPATMSVGQWGTFGLDIQNNGTGDAWNASIRDMLPRIATGGMCNQTPQILSAQVFAADGFTPVPGKGPLNQGSDYSFTYSAAPNCQLDIKMLTSAGTIGPNQHLIIHYQTQLDANTPNGATLTNVAGAVQWFNADSSVTNRQATSGLLTDGTPGKLDNQDAHTVTVAFQAYIFDKTVADLTTGVNPATTAAPGDKLRYTLRFRTNNQPLNNFNIFDDMDALNAAAAFASGTLAIVTSPSLANLSGTSSTGGTKRTGVLDVRNLNVAANSEVLIQFDITLKPGIANGAVVTNQATLRLADGSTFAWSDDPNVNGSADPTVDPAVSGKEDPTRVTIVSATAFQVQKISTYLRDPNVLLAGDTLRYTITVKNTGTGNAMNVTLRDAVPTNTTYVAGSTTLNGAKVADVAGVSPLVNGMLINSPADPTPGSMPAAASTGPSNVATITFDVAVNPNTAPGTVISNQGFVSATGIVNQPSDDPRTPAPNDPTQDVVGGVSAPALVVRKSGPATMNLGQWGNFSIDVQNTGQGDAWNANLRDLLPHGATGGMCSLTPEILSAQVFAADGVTPAAGKGPLNAGTDYSLSYSAAPNCQLDITMLTAAGRIGQNERLIVRYRTQLDANTQNAVALTNIAGAIQWFNADSSNSNRKATTGALTNGTPGILDNQDAFTVTTALSGWFFEKTVADLTSGANPATTAVPGDKLRYTLHFRTINQALSNFRIFDEMDAMNLAPDFVAGTLTLVTFPSGADTSATSSTGGAKGTGVIDVRNLNVPANSEVLIQFDITLKPAIATGTVVTNQATLFANGSTFALSDDPNVNGTADPNVSGDEDPTRVTIVSSSVFRVQKISTYLRDPNILFAGDTLRYTITVKNISNADAMNVALRDAVPANTAYVPGSTTLNGAKVADVAGASPLVNGMPINSPANATPGLMPADASGTQANTIATITFDVVVNPTTPDGTILSNQGFVSATGIVDQPSDDPRTPVPNDPTRDVVRNRPVLYAEKHVILFTDLGSPGIVDPGDVLRYTITIKNSATLPATGVVLKDPVPANTTYVANSTVLNGTPFGQPDGGAAPLASGITIGTIAAGATATLQYDLRVNLGTPVGTAISNQAVVSSPGLPNLLTDSSGNPANPPQPTVVVVGAGQQISISEQVSVVGGGAAVPGAQLDYTLTIQNSGPVPVYNLLITDDLNGTQPGQIAYVNQSATLNGSAAGVSFAGSTISANYGALNGTLAPGATTVVKFRATLNASLALGTVVTNTAVAAWGNPTQTANASVSITVGSVPGGPGTPGTTPAVLSGSAWFDANFDNLQNSGERVLAGWTVELYSDNQLSQSVQTDSSGAYRISNVAPNDTTGVRYELRFRAPGGGPNTALLGRAVSPFTNGLQRISDIIVPSGANLLGLNLALRPDGVIYNSMTRGPIAGATLSLLSARSSSPLPAACFDDAAQQGQITLADGYYRFDINFSDPACTNGGDYLIGVTPPLGASYVAGYSQIIPPTSSASTAAFSVPACPGSAADAIPATAQFCEAQPSEFAPAATVQPRSAGTTYYVHLLLDGSQIPGSSQIFNNHIPLDPVLLGLLTVTKTTSVVNVSRGQLVPYTITANNHSGQLLSDVSIVDRLPAGFSYIKGSALLDGVPTEPSIVGTVLSWNSLVIAGNQVRTVKVLLAVGAGNNEGEYVNHAQALLGANGNALSGEATATVRLVPDPTFDCTDVTGKIFNDKNRNGRQDDGEEGLSGVRVVTPTGLQATTDKYGRYHITCAIVPNDSRGSNFVLKLDDRTLPSGYRMTTDQVQIQRATSGKALQVNFGASINRVVSIDLLDAAFEPGTTEIRLQWKPRINLLLEELRKAPAILRLSYVADTEDAALVKRRMEAIKRQLTETWGPSNDSYVLTIEPEVFWRRGAPTKQPEVRVPGSR
jgi:uncharacterized repeat protein (TIGR01451 family)